MNPTKKELDILEFYAKMTREEDRYVWLREDEQGTYIEYAFKEGAPHDNRCLSWYDSFQPNAIRRNCIAFGDSEEKIQDELEWRKNGVKKRINQLFYLGSLTCGWESNFEYTLEESKKSWEESYPDKPFIKEHHICKVSCPAPKCIKSRICSHWTYEEPMKCACWILREIDMPTELSIPIEDAMRFYKYK